MCGNMFRIISCVLLYSTLIAGFPFPFPAAPVVPPTAVVPTPFPFVPGSTPVPTTVPFASPVRPVIPTPIPLAPGARPVLPGINNPYYNYAGGPAIPILSYSSEHGVDGTYAFSSYLYACFSFSTADGKQAQESGYLKDAFIDNAGNPQGTQVVQGSYAYISPEGTPIQVSYVADENGFRPSGVHIPADGKATPILPVDGINKQIFDPTYNRYDPYRSRYNNFEPYNRPYDPRYPYDPTKINPYYNPNTYNPYRIGIQNKNSNQETKKETV
ncbi:cuticular protein RR-1 [Spodoptera litura]|uniref:Cuticular protein RR-1 n=1 Tax=Spodoptera litura TaxID=69820 RepID=A0A4U7B8I0_SPOLT|nr:cuticular protein RR-1 [Spodoptera litura]